MADLDHEHDEFAVLDIADDAVIAYTVTPETIQFLPPQRTTLLPGVIKRRNSLLKIRNYARSSGLADFEKLLFGRVLEFNRPGQVRASLHPVSRCGFRRVHALP